MIGDVSIVHAEMPFLWRLDQSRCLEGVIDLALFDSVSRKCLILDWKTDRVPPDSTETLHDRYLPQLAAYWRAVTEMTKMDVAAAIYSTAAGALVRYETGDLEREWQRLEKLPAHELDTTIKPDSIRGHPRGRRRQNRLLQSRSNWNSSNGGATSVSPSDATARVPPAHLLNPSPVRRSFSEGGTTQRLNVLRSLIATFSPHQSRR